MNKEIADNIDKFRLHLVLACDFIMLSTTCVALCYVLFAGWAYYAIWMVTNALAVIVFRHWLYNSLQIPWLLSPFNRALKRFLDIVLSFMFILTVLPLFLLVQTFTTKRKEGGAVLSCRNMAIGEGKQIRVVSFCQKSPWEIRYINYSPIVLNIFIGTLSIWDLPLLRECEDALDSGVGTGTQLSASDKTGMEHGEQQEGTFDSCVNNNI